MSFTSMITGAKTSFDNPTSLFKNPIKEATAAFTEAQSGLSQITNLTKDTDPGFTGPTMPVLDPSTGLPPVEKFTGVPIIDPSTGLPPVKSLNTYMSDTLSGIQGSISDKLKNIGTDLLVCKAAEEKMEKAATTDAVLEPGATIPNAADKAYPETCKSDLMDKAFGVLTGDTLKNTMTAATDTVASKFDNTGPMTSVFDNLNQIPGVVIESGKDLLSLMDKVSDPIKFPEYAAIADTVKNTFKDTMSSVSGVMDGIKDSLGSVGDTVKGMGDAISDMFNSAKDAISEAVDFIQGDQVVGLLNNTDPCIKKVMTAVINPAAVDERAIVVKAAIDKKDIALPGADSVKAIESPTGEVPYKSKDAPSAESISNPKGKEVPIQKYTTEEIANMKALFTAERDLSLKMSKAAVTFREDSGLEKKIKENNYRSKRDAAGAKLYTDEGTTTNQDIKTAWLDVRKLLWNDLDYYHKTYVVPAQDQAKKLDQIEFEYNARVGFGKYPYTVLESRDYTVPEEKKSTYLDTTK